MSVLVVSGAGYVAGKEIVVLELIRGLRNAGHDARVAMSSWNDGDFASRMAEAHAPFYQIPLGFLSLSLTPTLAHMSGAQLLKWPALLRDYRRILRELKPATVLHTSLQHALLLWPMLSAERDVFWLHEAIPGSPRYRRMIHFVQRRLKGFVTVSHATAGSLRSAGVVEGRIRTIHNGLGELDSPHGTNGAARPSVVFGIAGQIGAWKGHELLIEAFSRVAGKFPQAELRVFGQGDPEYVRRLQARAADLGIADRILWRGFIRNRGAIFSEIDVCVAPSLIDEALGMTVIEASACGLPVIATRRGGLPEVVQDGVTGILVESGNLAALEQAMTGLILDPARRHEMGAQARARVRANFSIERFIEEFVQLIGESAGERSAGMERR
jgi:glycosyltransferase involved in cell wall biosynthesis